MNVGIMLIENDGMKIIIRPDGDSYMAAWDDFENIQESCCAFGDTPSDALLAFLREQELLREE